MLGHSCEHQSEKHCVIRGIFGLSFFLVAYLLEATVIMQVSLFVHLSTTIHDLKFIQGPFLHYDCIAVGFCSAELE